MQAKSFSLYFLMLLLGLLASCANIIPPTGGKADTIPPKLKSISPKDSLLNTRVSRIELKFDEFVHVSDVAKELQISPMLKQNATLTSFGKTVVLKIADSLLQDSTTYTVNFGKAIKDIHENNAYTAKPFVFSTGPWFDSLVLKGNVLDAESGKMDSSGAVKILLYEVDTNFTIVTKQKPMYVGTSNTKGQFSVSGLPNKDFRIFALKESNDNLRFDADEEYIGFADFSYNPSTDTQNISLVIFKEIPDTSRAKIDTNSNQKKLRFRNTKTSEANELIPVLDNKTFTYSVQVDTGNIEKRTQDIRQPINIYFSRKLSDFNAEKIRLSVDSAELELETKFLVLINSSAKKLSLTTEWKPNSVYTLRLLKGFATDSSGSELMPSKYFFRSKSEADYGTIEVNIPDRFVSKPYLLQVFKNSESVYVKPITLSTIKLEWLYPGEYKLSIVADTNQDGEWTTGSLKEKRHAEKLFPFPNTVLLKAGWENVVDFEPKKK